MKNNVDFTVVKMTLDDVSAVAELEKECFSAPWSEASLSESLLNGNSVFLCAKEGKKTVGYIGTSVVFDEAYVSDIAVSKSERRKGVGEKLLVECEKICREKNCSFLSLEVRKSNFAAIALYEKCGFVLVGERKNFYSEPRENALIMTKYFKD
ncbi:MAG: ribosomal protein S18-alanine N-acetyltransferase [Clostridia bacterium]|nr:ribosomal protein S18-alanine N-acetyltransferase [Clostridia bacterium]